METVSATVYPATPHAAKMLQSRSSPTQTRGNSMQEAGDQAQQAALSTATSQESFMSAHNNESRLQTTSSSGNISQSTSYTNLTSPTSSAAEKLSYEQQYASASQADLARVRTPENGVYLTSTTATNGNHAHDASPMSITTNGTKRTASGHIKNAPSLPSTPTTLGFGGRRARTDSMSSTHSRAGDLAQTLKSRLGYAMAKVQHGLEHKSAIEVESLGLLPQQKAASPNNRHSMSHLSDYGQRRPFSSHVANGRFSVYEATTNGYDYPTHHHPSKRHSGNYSTTHLPTFSSSQPQETTIPRLQPAPDIRPSSRHNYNHSTSSVSLPSTQTDTTMMSPPRTPTFSQPTNGARRPPSIRTNLEPHSEKERDALQALFQLGSPQGSQHHMRGWREEGLSQSPLRSEFAVASTPRRVTFARSESGSSGDSVGGELGKGI